VLKVIAEIAQRSPIPRMAERFHGQPLIGRWATAGAVCLGAMGAVTGLVIGLIAHPPTAAFAVVELGLPAAIVGGVMGLVTGMLVLASRRIRRSPR
jgi:hypothetical protein